MKSAAVNSLTVPSLGFEEHRLTNGLLVLLSSREGPPLVHVTVHYRVGSSDEEPGYSGLAHLFEHMMFQGSAHVAKNEHGRLIDAAGGRWNASTGKDRTNYFETVPSSHLELALWLEADRLSALAVTEENFENQRQTVIEEKKQVYDNQPYGRAYLRFDELSYRNWRYAHPVIGYEEDLRNLTHDDAVAFHRRFYQPANAVLALAGDFEKDRAMRWIEDYFGWIPQADPPVREPVEEPPDEQERVEEIRDPLAPLPAVGMGFLVPPLGTREDAALRLWALILAEGDSARLYRRFVYDQPWVTGLAAGTNHCRGPQQFRIWFQVQQGVSPDQVIQGVESEIERLQNETAASWELEKSRNQLTYRQVMRLERVSRMGEALAEGASMLDDPDFVNRRFETLLSVTADELREAAQRHLLRTRRTLVSILPEERS